MYGLTVHISLFPPRTAVLLLLRGYAPLLFSGDEEDLDEAEVRLGLQQRKVDKLAESASSGMSPSSFFITEAEEVSDYDSTDGSV